MHNHGWIMLHRKLLSSQMYRSLNSKQRDVMITCLLMANHSENDWQWGTAIFKCEPGQFVTSLESIVSFCSKDVSVQSVRTSLLKLEKWGFLTNKSTKTGRLITIVNWHTYQSLDQCSNSGDNNKPTKSQQRANRQLTTNNNGKNGKNENNEKENTPKPPTGDGDTFSPKDYLRKNGIEWIAQDIWNEWIDFKRKVKASVSERAIVANVKALSALGEHVANDIIAQSLDNGWKGLFALKNVNSNGTTRKLSRAEEIQANNMRLIEDERKRIMQSAEARNGSNENHGTSDCGISWTICDE